MATKLDEVSKNKIWHEHVRKETKTLRLNEQFLIPDPSKSAFPCFAPCLPLRPPPLRRRRSAGR